MMFLHPPFAIVHAAPAPTPDLNSKQLFAARVWLANCTWSNVTRDDIFRMTADRITKAIDDHYEGGREAFILDYRCGTI